ncbi:MULTISPECIES: hypothetical protein [unclassified Microcoleus]|uniref:hypothetical protein n=1 Tax=unclassified Microcoleus TaxID=2642155 RepID=UPI002FD44475
MTIYDVTLQVENEGTELTIQSIEDKGDGVIVVKVSVPPDANKQDIHNMSNSNLNFTEESFDDSALLQLDEISSKLITNINQLPHSPGLFQLVIDQLLKYYQLSIKAVEERYQAELKAKDAQIETYREEIAFLRELTVKLAKNPIVINSSQDNKPE